MKCPVCKQAMKKVRWQVTTNPNEGNKEYNHTTYHCAVDDVWVTTEIPAS